MPVGLSLNSDATTAAVDLTSVKVVIYEDDKDNTYTLDFSTLANPALKFLPKGGVAGTDEIDFSNLAGLVSAVGAIQTKVGTINTNVGATPLADTLATAVKLQEVKAETAGIKIKTDTIVNLDKLAAIETAAGKISGIETAVNAINTNVGTINTNVGEIKTNVGTAPLATADKLKEVKDETESIKLKTEKMPADLNAELAKFATAAELVKVKTDTGDIKLKTEKIPADLNAELAKFATATSVTELIEKIKAGSAAGSELKTTLSDLNTTLGGLKCEVGSAPAQVVLSSLQDSDIIPDAWTNMI